MKILITNPIFLVLLILLTGIQSLKAQQRIHVNVSTNIFTPSSIAIEVGDTVQWTNTLGTHNVNGTTATFPSNPESFGNSVGSGWSFEHVFKKAGDYNYRCDPHFSLGMTGTINVSTVTGINDKYYSNSENELKLYPSPVKDYFKLDLEKIDISLAESKTIVVYNTSGTEVYRIETSSSSILQINTDKWNKALYFVTIMVDYKPIFREKIVVQ